MFCRFYCLTCALALLLMTFVTGCSSPGNEPPTGAPVVTGTAAAAAPAPPQANVRQLAEDLPLLPMGIERAVRPVNVMRATYEFAAQHPEVMNFIPCFCGCERGGHRGNHDCFVSGRDAAGKVTSWEAHALSCEICVDVARDAMQMHNGGASVSQIRAAIDTKYQGPGRPGTPTPMPGSGGSH